MRPALILALLLGASRLAAQTAPLTPGDSALIYRILTAEDHRNASDSALAQGMANADPRVRALAARALARITDSTYAARRAGPVYAPRVTWPLPEWRPRLDSLVAAKDDCAHLERALGDSAWQVRFRAADVLSASCAASTGIRDTLLAWVARLPADWSHHAAGVPSWQPAAHAVRALARTRPAESIPPIRRLAGHPSWGVRLYTARAAGIAADTATLRRLALDRDDNVKEAAITALSALTGHTDDAIYRKALNSSGAQAVRAAALALKGGTDLEDARALDRALRRWLRRPNDSERDARLALLDAAGRPATEDRKWNAPPPLPADVVPLALGADVRLVVTMSPAAGGGNFTVHLRGDVAPITAARIIELVRHHYYDGLVWQRVIPDFVIQGGGPGANEYVGYTHFFRDELGTVSHLRGGVGMSTRGHDTGDGQWFFDVGDEARLDPLYTLFGEVVEGMDVVDAIQEGDRIASIRMEEND